MWRSLSIASKIWLSLSILIVGYFASMLFGYSNGQKTEYRLFSVSEAVFPASRFSQSALSYFDEQVKLYNDAVLMGDAGMLETAASKAKQVHDALAAVQSMRGIDPDTKNKIASFVKELTNFSKTAQTLYMKMIQNENDMDMNKIADLANQTKSYEKQLSEYNRYFVDKLNAELSQISESTKRQRIYSLITFIVVVAGSLLLIWFILSRGIIQPLKKTVEALNEIANGDLSIQLKTGRDEIGAMGVALNSVVESLKVKAKAASDIAARTMLCRQ